MANTESRLNASSVPLALHQPARLMHYGLVAGFASLRYICEPRVGYLSRFRVPLREKKTAEGAD